MSRAARIVPVVDLFPRRLRPPHNGCPTCAELAMAHAAVEQAFDRSAAVDVRIRMRTHQAAMHPR